MGFEPGQLMPLPILEWCLLRLDTLQLRELYGQAKGRVPPSVVELCLYCYVLMSLECIQVVGQIAM